MESSPDDSHIIEKVQGRATKLISSFILMKGYPCLIYPTYIQYCLYCWPQQELFFYAY